MRESHDPRFNEKVSISCSHSLRSLDVYRAPTGFLPNTSHTYTPHAAKRLTHRCHAPPCRCHKGDLHSIVLYCPGDFFSSRHRPRPPQPRCPCRARRIRHKYGRRCRRSVCELHLDSCRKRNKGELCSRRQTAVHEIPNCRQKPFLASLPTPYRFETTA